MSSLIRLCLLAGMLVCGSAAAEVTNAGPGGFTTVNTLSVSADRAAVWAAAVNDVGQWWHPDHTISGNAASMSIDPRPMGCFCEMFDDDAAGVVHLSVTMVNPRVVLRMTGGLGPLGLMGVNGNMTWEFEDAADGGTVVRFTYAVGGYMDGGLDAIAGPVDFVLGEALQRLQSFVETGNPERPPLE
ncbi:MAG: hypothetical protein AAFN50_01390 [Pseudomonadota bacterium]